MHVKISHMTLWVTDQDRALDFYHGKLGWEIRADAHMGDFRWLSVSPIGQPEVEINLLEPSPNNTFNPETIGHIKALLEANAMGGGVLEVGDVRAAYAELKAKGVQFLSEPTEQPYGIEAIIRDGVGNWFSLTQHYSGDTSGRMPS